MIYSIIAGINGSGKTTMFKLSALPSFNNQERINPDEILLDFGGDWRNPADQIAAGRIALQKVDDCIEKGVSFHQETTLCGNAILNQIKKAKSKDYIIDIYYVGLASAKLAEQRVQDRVLKGGHGIDSKLIEKRYVQSLNNLKKLIPICDSVYLFDNTVNYTKCAYIEHNNVVFMQDKFNLPEWAQDILNSVSSELYMQITKAEFMALQKAGIDVSSKINGDTVIIKYNPVDEAEIKAALNPHDINQKI